MFVLSDSFRGWHCLSVHLLAADVLAKKDVDKAIADRAHWRADERRWVREGKLPKCGWWPEEGDEDG